MQLYVGIKRMWAAVVAAAMPYMQEQSGARNFEFFGIDVIADATGQCWLVEANRYAIRCKLFHLSISW